MRQHQQGPPQLLIPHIAMLNSQNFWVSSQSCIVAGTQGDTNQNSYIAYYMRSKSKGRHSLSPQKIQRHIKEGKLVMFEVIKQIGEMPSLLSLTKQNHLVSLDLSYCKIQSLQFLVKTPFPSLQMLTINNNRLVHIDCLRKINMPKLRQLFFNGNKIDNPGCLAKCVLPQLQALAFNVNNVTEIDWLTRCDFPKLAYFAVTSNNIRDISCLRHVNFPLLVRLYLSNNEIQDISVLPDVNFPKLRYLSLNNNNIIEFLPTMLRMSNFTELEVMAIYDNKGKLDYLRELIVLPDKCILHQE